MPDLPLRPDLRQLRRRAKELHRAAAHGDAAAIARIAVVGDRVSLGAAQLALAREFGFPSWAMLKHFVETKAAAGLPLVEDKHAQRAVWTPQASLDRAREAGWDPTRIPRAAVFTSANFITAHLAGSPAFRRVDDLAPTNGHAYVTATGRPVVVDCLGNGAPALVTELEHLATLGVGLFVAVGPMPAVSNDVAVGECVVISHALRDDGVSQHYAAPNRYATADQALTGELRTACADAGFTVRVGVSWTVPVPYRTTAAELEVFRDEGVLTTDLVAAAMFTVAASLGVRAGAAGIVTRHLTTHATAAPNPLPPDSMARLLATVVRTLQDLGDSYDT